MDDLERRIERIEEAINRINHELGKVLGSQRNVEILVKYVVLPLIVIVGGLVGVKIVLP
jgi:ABC-type uncharacterized transport system involved in gliding motility auxiliary subunit